MSTLSNEWVDLTCVSDSGTGNGSTTDYVLSSEIKSLNGLFVYLNGLLQLYTTHYTANLGTKTVSFATAPAAGQKINIRYLRAN